MKIWWPWRRKPLQSLFEKRLPWTGKGLTARVVNLVSPRTVAEPHRLNAPGPFHVVNTECMACGYPHVLAPDLMAWEIDAEGRHQHCYFKKQPETPSELDQAVNAVAGSCCGALCYGGSDPDIRKRIG
jgi:hypothetical protein